MLANAVWASGYHGEARDILGAAADLLPDRDSSDQAASPQYRGEVMEGIAETGDIVAAEALIPSDASTETRMLLLGYLGAGAVLGGHEDRARTALKATVDLAATNPLPSYMYNRPDARTFGGYDPITAIMYAFVDTTDAIQVERLVRNLPNTLPKLTSIIYAVEHFCSDHGAEPQTPTCQTLADDAEAALAPAIPTGQDTGWKSNIAGLAVASVVLVKGVNRGQAVIVRLVPSYLRPDATQAAASYLAVRGQLALAQQLLPTTDPYQGRLLQDYRIHQHATSPTPSEPDSDNRDFETQFASAKAAGPMTMTPTPLQALLLATMMFDDPNHKPTPAETADALKEASQPQPGPQAKALATLAKRMANAGDVGSALRAEAPLEGLSGSMFDGSRSEALEAIAIAQINAGDFETAFETTKRITLSALQWEPLLGLARIPSTRP